MHHFFFNYDRGEGKQFSEERVVSMNDFGVFVCIPGSSKEKHLMLSQNVA